MRRTRIFLLAMLPMLVAHGCGDGERGVAGPPAGLEDLDASGRGSGLDLVLITVDTLRADRLGCYGRAGAGTPEIDALAAGGVLFEQATSGTPITLPSHATILTGLDAPRHEVRHNGTFRLDERHVTLAEELRAAGYATSAFIGAFVLDARYGLAQGFDEYDDAVRPRDPARLAMGNYAERPADEVVDAAIAWIDRPDAGMTPIMTWVHLFDPHAPYTPPAQQARAYPDDPYQGEIAFVDEQVGRLVSALRSRDRLDETLIVLVSDHGEGLGEHDEATHADLIYDSTMRVPMIFSNPRLFPTGLRVSDRLAGLVDLYPTLLGLLGVPVAAEDLDGVDLFATQRDPDRALYVETLAPLLDYGWSSLHGLRRLEDKLILAPSPEYYRLREDPGELSNRYGRDPGSEPLERRLRERMSAWPSALEVAGAETPLDAEARRRLASLGYLRGADRRAEVGVKDPKAMMPLRRRMHEAGGWSLQGRHREAAEEIEAVLAEDPESSKAWYTAVRIFDRSGDLGRAEHCVRRALALNPRADGWVILARYALARGDRDLFESALAQAERLDPLDGGVPIGRGHALAQDGQLAAALEQFRRAVEIDPVRSGPYARTQIERLEAALGR